MIVRSFGFQGVQEGVEIVIFRWSTKHGPCYDCGSPAAFKLAGEETHYTNNRCAVCAANLAADGGLIERIEPLE
jgi:hypothetical protein